MGQISIYIKQHRIWFKCGIWSLPLNFITHSPDLTCHLFALFKMVKISTYGVFFNNIVDLHLWVNS